MSTPDKFQKALLAEWVFKLSPEEEASWQTEYKRIGRKYATWGAIFAIIGSPTAMLSEMNGFIQDHDLWLFYRLMPAVVIAMALLLFKWLRYSHEILFIVIAYALYVDFAYWADCSQPDKFLYGQLTMLIPAAIITLLRPFFFIINFVVQFILIELFYIHYCHESATTFLSSKEFIPILIASISCYMVATFRYFLIKRNFIFSQLLRDALSEAEAGRQKSDELLKNILPEEIAEELKQKGNSAARGYDLVTILFTDFKNFTELSGTMSAIDLVAEIDVNFKALDGVCEKYGIEKIKTIGDAYMAAGGIPVPTEKSVKNTVLAALEMQDIIGRRMEENHRQGKVAFLMRAGIHTGPVVAGIVGVKKFQYDIWGDTVNTASRMETYGEVSRVNVSHTTYALLKDDPDFVFESRRNVNVKGKGEMEMWFVRRTS